VTDLVAVGNPGDVRVKKYAPDVPEKWEVTSTI
jgi:hypothetical protein